MSTPAFEQFQTMIIEKMAGTFEESGQSPLVGRIYSLLLFAPEAISLQDIADKLGVTKAAISVQIRVLESSGLCAKLPRGKDRKDYYFIPDNHLQVSMTHVMQRLKSDLDAVEETLEQVPDKEGLLPEEQRSVAALEQRYNEMLVFYRALFRRIDGVMEEMAGLRQLD